MHKLSKCLIEECLDKEIKVIIVGKNKGWKNEINNGKVNNRAMYNFPHAKFIETLKYKALLKDIVVIEVEESYTSKTSFMDNEKLRVFNNEEEKDLTQGITSYFEKDNGSGTWSISARGTGYLTAFNKKYFIKLCEILKP